jgi:hypothetical protein
LKKIWKKMAPGGGWGLFFWKKWPQGIDFFQKVAPPPPGAIFQKIEKTYKWLNCSGKCKIGLKKCNFKPNSVPKKKSQNPLVRVKIG